MDAENKYRDIEKNSEELNNMEIENNPTKDFFYFLLDLVKTGVIVFLIAFALRYYVIQPFIVDGESMQPNYVDHQYLLAEKVSYLVGDPDRGDVIVFRYPGNPNVSYIKRIIALPGERLTINNNKIMIYNTDNPEGKELDESYIPASFLTMTMDKTFEKNVGPNEYFVLGDNRQHSSDSREWGILPKANIIGKAWFTIMPKERIGFQKNVTYPGLSIAGAFAKNQ